jgi:hypothetical protein
MDANESSSACAVDSCSVLVSHNLYAHKGTQEEKLESRDFLRRQEQSQQERDQATAAKHTRRQQQN